MQTQQRSYQALTLPLRFRILNFKKYLLFLNCDSASANVGAYGGLVALIKEKAPWLELVHFFSQRI